MFSFLIKTNFDVFFKFLCVSVWVTSNGNKRHEEVWGVGGNEMGESGGEDVGSVTNRAIALVYELQLLFVCGRWTRTPHTKSTISSVHASDLFVCIFMQNIYIPKLMMMHGSCYEPCIEKG